jgi:hypothetical protein
MFARKLIQALTLSVAGLIAAPSIGSIVDAGPAEAHAKKNKGKKAFKKRIARQRDKRRDQNAERSLARTRLVLRAALRSVAKHEDGKGRLVGAILHQRAAKIALSKDKPGAAMWLTRQARQMARNVIRENRGEMPKGGSDRPGEWLRANQRDAPRFIELAKRHRSRKEVSPEVKEAISKTRKLVVKAAKAAKTGGEGKDQLRKAMVNQKAARKAAKGGKDKVALHLTKQARDAAREVIKANGGGAEATGEDTELAGAEATGSEEFTAEAETGVAQEIDPTAVEDEVTGEEIDEELEIDDDESEDSDTE